MKKRFPISLLMGPAYLILGLMNLYAGRTKKDWSSMIFGLLDGSGPVGHPGRGSAGA